MRIKIWGCRGSVPTPGAQTVEFGGNTSCVEVCLDSGAVLVLDAGTGIRALGADLAARGVRRVQLLLTHLHLDHLEGLRFFAPLWDADVSVDIWGPPSPVASLRERIARSFSPPLFPVDFRDVPADVTIYDVPWQTWTLEGASVTAALLVHPGPTVGYRIEADGVTFAYVPDHEPALTGIDGRPLEWVSGAVIAEDADLLVHDAQYSDDEYGERIGWGHSSMDDALAYARAVGARRVVLFHHEPQHDDAALARLERQAHELGTAHGLSPQLAREGMVVDVEAALAT